MASGTTLSPRKCLTCCTWFQTLSIPNSVLFLVLCSPAFQCCPRSVDGATPFLTSSRFHDLCETVFPLSFPSCVLFSFSQHCLLSLSLCPHQPQLMVPLLIVLPFPNVFYPQHTAGLVRAKTRSIFLTLAWGSGPIPRLQNDFTNYHVCICWGHYIADSWTM